MELNVGTRGVRTYVAVDLKTASVPFYSSGSQELPITSNKGSHWCAHGTPAPSIAVDLQA